MIQANGATLFAAGVVIDIIAALYYVTASKDKIVLAALLNFAYNEFVYISYAFILSSAKLEENLVKVHWYAAGCGVGTLIGLAIGLRRNRKAKEPPKRGRLEAPHLTTTVLRTLSIAPI
jgi:hypothetical protein